MRKRDLLVTVGDDGEDQRNIVKFWAVDQDKRDIRGPSQNPRPALCGAHS